MTMITTGAIRNTRAATASAVTATVPGPLRCPSLGIRSAPLAFGCTSPSSSSPALEDALEANDPAIAREAHQRQREQDDRQRRGEGPVERDLHFALDEHGDHHVARAAHERGRDEEAQAQDEDQQRAAGDPGQREGQGEGADNVDAAPPPRTELT